MALRRGSEYRPRSVPIRLIRISRSHINRTVLIDLVQGRAPSIYIFTNKFKCITRRISRFLPQKLESQALHLTFLLANVMLIRTVNNNPPLPR